MNREDWEPVTFQSHDEPQTIQEGYAALRQVLGFNDPERPDKPKPSDLAVLNAALKALQDTQRERTGLARPSDPTAPGWRDLDYEEPPLREPVLLKTEDGTVFIGTFEGYGTADDVEDSNINEDTIQDEADDFHDAPVFFQDGDHHDGDVPVFWSYIPAYDYDDLTSDDDVDTVTDDSDDDSEVYYREIDDNPPPVGEMVLLLTAIADEDNEGEIHANDPVIGWCDDDGIYYTEDGGQDVEIDEPTHWSPLPKLPDIDGDDS